MKRWLKLTLRMIWWKTAVRFWYSVIKRESWEVDYYCDRCGGCGYDECCAAERCDNGFLCAGFYGDKKNRLRIIKERNES